jgi:DNA-binding transcriptional ArsR family regulator
MPVGHTPSAEVAVGTAFALLVALSAASRAPRDEQEPELAEALDAVGDAAGETWLNLLGVALDAGADTTGERLADVIAALNGVELRRHLLGRYAWSWCTLGGVEDIEAAAAGDAAAAARLLTKPRYYGGEAERSLGVLIGLDGDETKQRIVAAVQAGATLLPAGMDERLEAAEQRAKEALAANPIADAIEQLASGYRYVPEVEADRVVLIPHLELTLPLVLAQHRSARVIAYYTRADRGSEERALALGRALADPKRVEILVLVGRGLGRSSDLVEATGLARSTVHHHLAQLREAGLVALEGNARAYRYTPRREAVAEVAALVADVIGMEGER